MRKFEESLTKFLTSNAGMIIIVVVSVLGAVVDVPFFTKGEPREALVSVAMLERGDFILPNVYAGEVAFKPPMFHWLIALFSFVAGGVTEMTARLPSVLAFFLLCYALYRFVIKNDGRRSVAVASLLVYISFFEVHRNASLARVDMLLAMTIAVVLMLLFKEMAKPQLPKFPWLPALVISVGFLTKGPVALAIPFLVVTIYALVYQRRNWEEVLRYVAVLVGLSLVLPLIWYVLAAIEGGSEFLKIIYAENIGRFISDHTTNIRYNLGHEKPALYILLYLVYGLLPWLSVFIAAFCLHVGVQRVWKPAIGNQPQNRLVTYSWLSIVVITVFYAIPSSKRSVYLLPLFPFAAYLVVDFWKSVKWDRVKQVTGYILIVIAVGFGLAVLVMAMPFMGRVLENSDLFLYHRGLNNNIILTTVLVVLMIATSVLLGRHLKRGEKQDRPTDVSRSTHYHFISIAYIALIFVFAYNIVEGPAMNEYRYYHSSKGVWSNISETLNVTDDGTNYVVCRLDERYNNLYGIAFYSGLHFKQFNKGVSEGTLWCWDRDIERLQEKYGEDFNVTVLYKSTQKIKEGGQVVLLKMKKK